MDLYGAPMSCSLASHIALLESGQDAICHYVSLSRKTLLDGSDYMATAPKGQVPALRLDDGALLTEGPAVLQFIADRKPDSGLAPEAGTIGRYRLQEWLNFLSTELHKQVFAVVFNPGQPAAAKAYAAEVALKKFEYLNDRLDGRAFLLGDGFTIADAYCVTILNWAAPAGLDLAAYPALAAYHARHLRRPAVARAIAEEMAVRAQNAL